MFDEVISWTWRWEDFCETGNNISSKTSVITPCFQQLHIQLPTYGWFAVFSAYHYGFMSGSVYRNRTQMACLNLRALFVLCLAIVPAVQILMTMNNEKIWPVDILLTCVQFLAWVVHFGESPLIVKLNFRK
jgi:ATP-binding cassette, subfamily C (CFTR/MRP), member 10